MSKVLVSKVSSLFASRVSEVTLPTGREVRIGKSNAGRTLIAFHDALVSGADVYAFAGKLIDLKANGEFTVAEGRVVDFVVLEITKMAESGVVFTAMRGDMTAGQETAVALRTVAREMKAAGVTPAPAKRTRKTAK
jgi:hypothetical protein